MAWLRTWWNDSNRAGWKWSFQLVSFSLVSPESVKTSTFLVCRYLGHTAHYLVLVYLKLLLLIPDFTCTLQFNFSILKCFGLGKEWWSNHENTDTQGTGHGYCSDCTADIITSASECYPLLDCSLLDTLILESFLLFPWMDQLVSHVATCTLWKG